MTDWHECTHGLDLEECAIRLPVAARRVIDGSVGRHFGTRSSAVFQPKPTIQRRNFGSQNGDNGKAVTRPPDIYHVGTYRSGKWQAK